MVRLRLGANAELVREQLRHVEYAASNVRGAGHTGGDLLTAYLKWASESVRVLRYHISAEDIDRLVLTRRYWALQGSTEATLTLLPLLVGMEIDERIESLKEARDEIDRLNHRWPHGHLIVLDTSALIHGPKLQEWDPAAEFSLGEVPVHIVLPIIVLDELDALKEHNREHTRSRARRTLNWLSNHLHDDTLTLRERRSSGPNSHAAIVLHVLADPAGHRRLPLADDEIVDRAAVVASTSGRDVTLYTNDFSQAYRAQRARLKTAMVIEPIYDVDLKEARREQAQRTKRARHAEHSRRPADAPKEDERAGLG